jgi:hypothetical protein
MKIHPQGANTHAPDFDKMPTGAPSRPNGNIYWVVPHKFLAGEYPGDKDPVKARKKIKQFLAAGIRHFVDRLKRSLFPASHRRIVTPLYLGDRVHLDSFRCGSPRHHFMVNYPQDRKLAGALKTLVKGVTVGTKRDKLEKDWRKLEAQVISDEVKQVLVGLWKSLNPLKDRRTQPTAEEARQTVQLLRDRKFVESAAVLFIEWTHLIAKHAAEAARVAPTLRAFKAWIKTAKISKRELEEQLLSDLELAYRTVGADWLLANAKLEKLDGILIRLLAQEQRPSFLTSCGEALASVFGRDKRGALLVTLLRKPDLNESQLKAIAGAIRSGQTALKSAAEVLPELVSKEAIGTRARELTLEIFGQVMISEADQRQLLTVALARIVTGVLLLERRSPAAEDLLATVSDLMKQLRISTREPRLQARTWVVENLEQETPQARGGLQVTTDGIRQFASAFEKASQGFAAGEILATLAENLGLNPVGKVNESLTYDPIRHQDLEGGLLPGDQAMVNEAGWAYGDCVAIRAKVRADV